MIRPAKFIDMPGMTRLIQRTYERSHYGKTGIVRIDPKLLHDLLLACLMRHGGECWVAVAENGGVITGMIIGAAQPVYQIGDKLTVQDLFWVSSDGMSRDAKFLLRSMIEWAFANPQVVEIKCSTNTVIMDDPNAGRILERAGMQLTGNVYRMECSR